MYETSDEYAEEAAALAVQRELAFKAKIAELQKDNEKPKQQLNCYHIWRESSPIDTVSTCGRCGLTR